MVLFVFFWAKLLMKEEFIVDFRVVLEEYECGEYVILDEFD